MGSLISRLSMIATLACGGAALLAAEKTHEFCNTCHAEMVADFKTHKHFAKGISCDACHGPSEKHGNANGQLPPDRVAAPDEVPALCGGCHPGPAKQYASSTHAKIVAAKSEKKAANCAVCHGVHRLRTQAQVKMQCNRCHAQLPASHPSVAVSVSCWSCHQPHTLLVAKK